VQKLIRDSGHLIQPAIVLLAGLGLFMVIRGAVVPKGFGQYGHFRPGALAAIRDHPVVYAGQAACVECHDEAGKVRAAGKHAHVACETCHGPLAKHAKADDPSAIKPALPTVGTLCVRCHEKDTTKPKTFPQVVSAEHSGGMACNECHKPHNPKL
jgi:cytochrome c553